MKPTCFSIPRTIVTILFLLPLTACGGGSSGDGVAISDSLSFQGSFARRTSVGRTAQVVFPVATISALGASDVTDEQGVWGFRVSQADVVAANGEVLFSINGDGVETSLVVSGIAADSTEVTLVFEQDVDGQILISNFEQNGSVAPGAPVDDGEVEPQTEAERACALIDATRISIVDAVMQVEASASDCPVMIDNIITVTNSGTTAFEYEVTVDLSEVTVAPLGGFLNPGETVVHNGAYRCGSDMNIDTSINARVASVSNESGEMFSDGDLALSCGADSNLSGLVDISQIQVNLN